jgi:hypothetical protein
MKSSGRELDVFLGWAQAMKRYTDIGRLQLT